MAGVIQKILLLFYLVIVLSYASEEIVQTEAVTEGENEQAKQTKAVPPIISIEELEIEAI